MTLARRNDSDHLPFDGDFDDFDLSDEDEEAGSSTRPKLDPHFFRRQDNGTVRLRLTLSAEEAALIEEAAGATPVMIYIHRVLKDRAHFHVKKMRSRPSGRR